MGWKVGKQKRTFGKEDFQAGGQDGEVQDRTAGRREERTDDSRLVDGNEDEILLEQIHVSGPRLHPVVLPFLDPADGKPQN